MEFIFGTFHQAQYQRSGPVLAGTLTPIPPPHDPTLLRRFHRDSNVFSIKNDIHRYIKTPQSYLTKAEANAWIEIYVAYWKAIGEILRAETGYHRDDWAIKVYEAWKEVTELLIRGFSHAGFGAWLMPCLYTAGKYLRVFAIKADEEKATKVGNGTVKMEQDILADDIAVDLEKNERLEDAARVINKIFTLCYSDRYVDVAYQFKLFDPVLRLSFSEHPSRTPENGVSTTPRIFSSKPTSRYELCSTWGQCLLGQPLSFNDRSHNPAELHKPLQELSASIAFREVRHAANGSLSQISHRHFSILRRRDSIPRRRILKGISNPFSPIPQSMLPNPSLITSRPKKISLQHGTCVTNPPIETKSPPPFPQSNPSQVPKLTTLSPHRLLLTYLIPTHLHTTLKLPTPSLLSTLPHLAPLFISLLSSIKQGHLYAFSAALSLHESTFVKRRIYLSLERARDICLRNLLRKVWLLEGGKENTRVKVGTFAAGVRFSMYGQQIKTERGEMMIEDEEVECLVAGLIYKVCVFGCWLFDVFSTPSSSYHFPMVLPIQRIAD